MKTLHRLVSVAALALTAAAPRAQFSGLPVVPPSFEICGANACLDFTSGVSSPTSVELAALRHTGGQAGLQQVGFDPGSGDWTLRFVVKGSDAADWFEFSTDGSVKRSAPGMGSLDALTLDSVITTVSTAIITWSASISLGGASSDMTIQTTWSAMAQQPAMQTRLSCDVLGPGPLPFYLSTVSYPEVHVDSWATPEAELLVPWVNGTLIRDPTNPALPFKATLDAGSNFFPLNASCYSDGGTPVNTSFGISTDDGEEVMKELYIARSVDGVLPGSISYRYVTVPDDVFDSLEYTMPYQARLSVFQGDWWTFSERYRLQLQTQPWYAGPVGSPSSTVPEPMADLVAQILLQPGFTDDHMDLIARQIMDMHRVLGPDANAILYGGHSPDEFDEFYFRGYLPGRPSFVAAVREGQKQFRHTVSPYIQSSQGVDYLDPALDPPISNPTQLMLDVQAAFLEREDGTVKYFPGNLGTPPRSGYLCSGSGWWRDHFPDNTRQIGAFTGMSGAYLDFFLMGICYSEAHTHAPGGGAWPMLTRVDQVSSMTAPPFEDLVAPMEFLHGRLTESVHGMNADPAANLMWAEFHEGTQVPEPMANAVTVPFFESVFDNVVMSRITTTNPSDSGRRAWVEANNVFTFGQIPGITRPLADIVPVFSQRFAYAPYYSFLEQAFQGLGPGPGGGFLSVPVDPVDDPDDELGAFPPLDEDDDFVPPKPSLFHFQPQKESLNVPYLRFLGVITRVLRDHGFKTWHNGTLVRTPGFTVTLVEPLSFDTPAGVETDPAGLQTNSPVYTEEPLTPGMYQAPADLPGADAQSLAFVAANPWVDPFDPATFDLTFVIRTHDYIGWTAADEYTVTVYAQDGSATLLPGTFTGNFDLVAATGGPALMEPGDVRWWVLRKTGVDGSD